MYGSWCHQNYFWKSWQTKPQQTDLEPWCCQGTHHGVVRVCTMVLLGCCQGTHHGVARVLLGYTPWCCQGMHLTTQSTALPTPAKGDKRSANLRYLATNTPMSLVREGWEFLASHVVIASLHLERICIQSHKLYPSQNKEEYGPTATTKLSPQLNLTLTNQTAAVVTEQCT